MMREVGNHVALAGCQATSAVLVPRLHRSLVRLKMAGWRGVCNLQKHIGIWTQRMAGNPKLIFEVAQAATEAADYILGFTERVEAGERLREGWAA